MPMTILRLPAVVARTGVSRATHYNRINDGVMTQPVALGPRARGWPESEIDTLNAARIAGKTDAEMRQLVRELEAARVAALGPVFDAYTTVAKSIVHGMAVDHADTAMQGLTSKLETAGKAKA